MAVSHTFVLVHGGFHWGGCFAKLANALAARGHSVIAPDLAGHGFDATPLTQIQGMEDYCAPVADVLTRSSRPVVLLGHSLGGASVTYLAERFPERIALLVYLAAVMPGCGTAVADCPVQSALSPLVTFREGAGLALAFERRPLQEAFYADCTPRDVDVAMANLIEVNPLAPLVWKSDATPARFGRIPRVYIETLSDAALPLAEQRRYRARHPVRVS